LSAVETKLTEMPENLGKKTLNFWRQVPESKYPQLKIPI